MFTPRIAVLSLIAVAGLVRAGQSPELGKPVDADELEALDYTIMPNGDGLPAGSGTAREGETVYRSHCIACHGEGGTGGIDDALAGGQGSLSTAEPKKSVGSYWPYATTVFDYVRRAMPLTSPGVLTDDELYSVTAYLLFLNGIVGRDDEIDADTLPSVRMPNRDGFVSGYKPGN